MEYNHVLVNFCERKLFSHRPEYLNASSALYISAIGYYNLTTIKNKSINMSIIYWCFCINGISSFLYHWYAWYIFKLLDEYSMILPIWFGLCKILFDLNYNKHYIGAITLFNTIILVMDVFPWFNPYFPICFLIELLLLVPIYYQSIKVYPDTNYSGIKGIIICSFSGLTWWITELNCNENLLFGHAIWHIGMSTGMCYKIRYFSMIENKAMKSL